LDGAVSRPRRKNAPAISAPATTAATSFGVLVIASSAFRGAPRSRFVPTPAFVRMTCIFNYTPAG
jgi:hypothetical protein